jgi:hypothetical protein
MDKNIYKIEVTFKMGTKVEMTVNAANAQHAQDKVRRILDYGYSITSTTKIK